MHALAWSLATGAAVTLSWWGVHTVMSGTAYDRPRALPISADATTQGAKPQASSTQRPPKKTGEAQPFGEGAREPVGLAAGRQAGRAEAAALKSRAARHRRAR